MKWNENCQRTRNVPGTAGQSSNIVARSARLGQIKRRRNDLGRQEGYLGFRLFFGFLLSFPRPFFFFFFFRHPIAKLTSAIVRTRANFEENKNEKSSLNMANVWTPRERTRLEDDFNISASMISRADSWGVPNDDVSMNKWRTERVDGNIPTIRNGKFRGEMLLREDRKVRGMNTSTE